MFYGVSGATHHEERERGEERRGEKHDEGVGGSERRRRERVVITAPKLVWLPFNATPQRYPQGVGPPLASVGPRGSGCLCVPLSILA